MNEHKRATPDRPIHELIARRWSPYAFAERPVSQDDLRSLFEAARWAASSYNEQPWSYLVATKDDPADLSDCSPASWREIRPGPRRPRASEGGGRLMEAGVRLEGASDHCVSEAL